MRADPALTFKAVRDHEFLVVLEICGKTFGQHVAREWIGTGGFQSHIERRGEDETGASLNRLRFLPDRDRPRTASDVENLLAALFRSSGGAGARFEGGVA